MQGTHLLVGKRWLGFTVVAPQYAATGTVQQGQATIGTNPEPTLIGGRQNKDRIVR
jgi:hypothetical protein